VEREVVMKRTLAERLDAIERRVEELVAERDNMTAQAGEWQRAANEAENKLTRALAVLTAVAEDPCDCCGGGTTPGVHQSECIVANELERHGGCK
jgi:DNA repair exonuclease SbcCD ATPase subunit